MIGFCAFKQKFQANNNAAWHEDLLASVDRPTYVIRYIRYAYNGGRHAAAPQPAHPLM